MRSMTERRFKAVGTVVAANYGRLCREGNLEPNAALKALEGVCQQRAAEAQGAQSEITTYIPSSEDQLKSLNITDIDIVEAVNYYTTPRGQHSGSPNKLNVVSTQSAFSWDAFHLTDQLLTQPLQIIVGGGKVGVFGSFRDGFELFNKARSLDKNIFVVENASHYDLYDKREYTDIASEKLIEFYRRFL